MFSKWTATARQHEVTDINQTQSMNDAVSVWESPQAGFHERFLAPHVSKIGGNTMIPSCWSVDKTVHGFSTTEHTDGAPIATFETTRGMVRRTCRKLVALTQFCKCHRRCRPHVARPRLPEEMHTSRLLCELENQMTQQVSRKSDEIDGMRLEKTLGCGQVFDP